MSNKSISIIIFLILSILFSKEGFSQEDTETNDEDTNDAIGKITPVIPPLPNVAALHKFAEIPVNNFTGIPDISVLLYELKGKDLSVPVSLNYHTGNVKVDQPASNVGLGWALNAGGSISRTVHGLPDELEIGYVKSTYGYDYDTNLSDYGTSISEWEAGLPSTTNIHPLAVSIFWGFIVTPDSYNNYKYKHYPYYSWNHPGYEPNNFNVTACHKQLVSASEGRLDLEPDVFSLSLPNGRTAQFVFNKNKQVVLLNQQDISIETNLFTTATYGSSDVWWKVKDGFGNTYYFGGIYEYSNYYQEPATILSGNPYENFPSAWHLKSISSVGEEEFRFIYEKDYYDDYELAPNQKSEFYISISSLSSCRSLGYSSNRNYRRNIAAWRIKKIKCETNENMIFFQYDTESERTDIGSKHRLKSITILDSDSIEISSYQFSHSYKNRLQLDKIELSVTKDRNKNKMDFRIFNYSNSKLFPLELKKAFDHWGYYNGKNSCSNNLPNSFNFRVSSYSSSIINPGTSLEKNNNRETDDEYLETSVLKNIVFPTGGYTKFEYEPNIYSTDEKDYSNNKLAGAVASGFPDVVASFEIDPSLSPPEYQVTAVYGSYYTFVSIHADLNCDNTNQQGTTNDFCDHHIGIRNTDTGDEWSVDAENGEYNPSNPFCFLLEEGNYEIFAGGINNDNPGNRASIEVYCEQVKDVSSFERIAGGLRIKTISYNDGNSIVKEKEYKYINPDNQNKCSGLLLDQPFYESYPYYSYISCDESDPEPRHSQTFRLTSNSKIKHLGHHMCYSDVIVSEIGNGKIHYKYSTERDIEPFMLVDDSCSLENPFYYGGGWSFINPVSKASYRGKLLTETFFNNIGDTVSLTNYYHSFVNKQQIPIYNTELFIKRIIPDSPVGILNPNHASVRYAKSYIESVFTRLDSTVTTNYFGSNKVITKKSYDYNLANYQQNSVTTRTGSDVITSKTYYTCDYNSTLDNIGILKNAHIISLPVKSVQTKYNISSNNLPIKPLQTKSHSRSARIVKYTNLGKPEKLYVSKMGEDIDYVLNPDNYGDLSKYYLKAEYSYNSNNLLYFTNILDNKTYYHYGYNNAYPVAEIVGADTTDIINAIGYLDSLDVDDINLKQVNEDIRASLPDSFMVNTYTYEPLIGIKTQTDPNGKTAFYDYDNFNRLEYIKDNELKIKKKYVYKYLAVPLTAPEGFSHSLILYNQINLIWHTVDDAEKYNLYYSSDGNTYKLLSSVNSTQYKHIGLKGNTNYYYKLRAFKEGIESPPIFLNVKTEIAPPPIPTGLSATATGYNTIELNWPDVQGETSYRILISTNPDWIPPLLFVTLSENTTSHTFSNLDPLTKYYYKIAAYNNSSFGYSDPVEATTWQTPPISIHHITAKSFCHNSVEISWNNVENETNYRIVRSTEENGNYTEIGIVLKDVTTFTDNYNLSGNTTYYYKVEAFNDHYNSGFYVIGSCKTKKIPPATPQNFVAVCNSNDQIQLTWTDVEYEENYTINKNFGHDGLFKRINLDDDATSYIDNNVFGNTTYYYYIYARNSDASSAHSNTISVTTWEDPPRIPDHFFGSTLSNSSVKITWAKISEATGGYVIYKSLTENGTYIPIAYPDVNTTSFTDENLNPNTYYYYKIESKSEHYTSVQSSPVGLRTLMNMPGAPAIISLSDITNNSIKVNWSDVYYEENYILSISTSESGPFTYVTKSAGSVSHTFLRIFANTTYYFRIMAKNRDQSTAFSSFKNAKTKKNIPGVPTGVTGSALSNSQIRVSWNKSAYTEWFDIYRSTSPSSGYIKINTSPISEYTTNFTNTGLSSNTTYYYKLKAHNSDYSSNYSGYISCPTMLDPPGTPSITSITGPSSTQISLNWTNVSGEQGYYIYRGIISGNVNTRVATLSAGVTSYTNSSLSSGTRYYYKVVAFNKDHSRTSGVANTITRPAIPGTINGPAEVCVFSFESINYSVGSVKGADSYTWVVPSGWTIISGQNTNNVTIKKNKSVGNVQVRTNNSSGSSAYKSKTVTSKPPPGSIESVFGAIFVTPGTTYSYSVGDVSGADSYVWSVPAGATIVSGQGTTFIRVIFSGSGTVSVSARNCNGFSQQSSIKVYKNF